MGGELRPQSIRKRASAETAFLLTLLLPRL